MLKVMSVKYNAKVRNKVFCLTIQAATINVLHTYSWTPANPHFKYATMLDEWDSILPER